jgi:hypothetical protein
MSIETVAELIEELKKLDPSAGIAVHCHGCCNHAHDIREVRVTPTPGVEICDDESDVIIEVV